MLNEVKRMITLASPERILLNFESAAISAFRSVFPNATVTGCYFHLTQSVMRNVNRNGMKEDYQKNDMFKIGSSLLTSFSYGSFIGGY